MRLANRLLLVIFMMALLPLRTMAGDVMATQMAAGEVRAAQLKADSAINTVAASARSFSATSTFTPEKAAADATSGSSVAKAGKADNAAQADKSAAAAMPDCHSRIQSGAVAQTDFATSGGMHGSASDGIDANTESCSACQACHSVAIAATSSAVLSTSSNPAQPLAVAIDFTSASVALGQKPPIA